jgi:hypothetical protein
MRKVQQSKAPPRPSTQQMAYSTAEGNYNGESGRKTLFLVATIIALVTLLSIISLLMINKKSSILIQSTSTEKQTPSKNSP